MNIKSKNIILVVIFLLLQIIWFNHVALFGRFAPLIYLYPLLILPVEKDESFRLIIAFIIGWSIDLFANTGGVFAATTLLVVFLKKMYFMLNKSPSQDIEDMRISKLNFMQKMVYFFIFIFLSQVFLYLFDSFSIELVISKIGYILMNSLVTLFFFIFIDSLFFSHKE